MRAAISKSGCREFPSRFATVIAQNRLSHGTSSPESPRPQAADVDPQATRRAVVAALHQAKRNKAFQNSRFIGLAVDGTGAGRTDKVRCRLCVPIQDAKERVCGALHHFALLSVVGVGLSLPIDVEPYGPGDSEYAAAQRLLRRNVGSLGRQFADYVVGDGEFATAPFLHTSGDLKLPVVAWLKENLPLLCAAVRARFDPQPPQAVFPDGDDRVELWDYDRFDPWEGLEWPEVRVLRYRQHKPVARWCRPSGSPTFRSAKWAV